MCAKSSLVPVVARVECRSEGAADERPVAVWLGRERCQVDRLLDDAVVGPAEAGASSERRVAVELDNGGTYVLRRSLPAGEWRVFQRTTASADTS